MELMDIVRFLSPLDLASSGFEPLPVIFFTVIWGLFVLTLIGIYRKANKQNWEKNWKLDGKASLDAEHSSVMEICDAVATRAEQTASIMPGTLLIIGLLGTFIGLGLALDQASVILINSSTADSIDSSLSNLMGMLDGLGTKFKTSTWGLFAFILLKLLLAKNGCEEKRLRWSIEKVKAELDEVREREKNEERANNQKLVDCMQGIAHKFHDFLNGNQLDNQNQLQQLVSFSEEVIKVSQDGQQANLIRLSEHESNIVSTLELVAIKQEDMFKSSFKDKQLYNEIIVNGFNTLAGLLEKNHSNVSTLLRENIQQSKESRDALIGFVEKNEATVTLLGESAVGMSTAAESMSGAAQVMGNAATHLQEVIDRFRINMEQVVELMKRDLNSTISGMNASFSENMASMANNLNSSIGDMSDSFKDNMSEMSKDLYRATSDISNAVNSLSNSVDITMSNVTSTIDSSMDLQKKAQAKFIVSTDTLNEYVIEMSELVNKLSGDIKMSLTSVSESNNRMRGVAKSIETLAGCAPENSEAMSNVSNNINQMVDDISSFIDAFARNNKAFDLQLILNELKDFLSHQNEVLVSTLSGVVEHS